MKYELTSAASKNIVDPTAEQWSCTHTKHCILVYAHYARRHRLDKHCKHIPTKRISAFHLQSNISEPRDANASQSTAFPAKYSRRERYFPAAKPSSRIPQTAWIRAARSSIRYLWDHPGRFGSTITSSITSFISLCHLRIGPGARYAHCSHRSTGSTSQCGGSGGFNCRKGWKEG